jgi:transposase-like protein
MDPVTNVDSPPDRKGVLFCPACDHANPVDGDWILRERAASVEYRCPDCRFTITERERHRAPHPAVRLWSAWLRAATAWTGSMRRVRI